MARTTASRLFADYAEAKDYADNVCGLKGYSETHLIGFDQCPIQKANDPTSKIDGWKVTTETYYG